MAKRKGSERTGRRREPLPEIGLALPEDYLREHRRDWHFGDYVTSETLGAFGGGFLRGAGYLGGKIPVFRLEGPNGEERLLPVDDAILPAAGYCYRQAEIPVARERGNA